MLWILRVGWRVLGSIYSTRSCILVHGCRGGHNEYSNMAYKHKTILSSLRNQHIILLKTEFMTVVTYFWYRESIYSSSLAEANVYSDAQWSWLIFAKI